MFVLFIFIVTTNVIIHKLCEYTIVKDVMPSANQIIEGMKESTGIDLTSIIAGYAGAKLAMPDKTEE